MPIRSCIIYEGQCSCKLSYIGELKSNSQVRWREHKDPAGKSEPQNYLMDNTYHKFTLKVLSAALSHFCRRKTLEAFSIAIRKPALKDQLEHHSLSLFHHGITQTLLWSYCITINDSLICFLQSWPKYMTQTLVLVWNSTLWEKFNFNF